MKNTISSTRRECIILFTRFPQPGRVKTRMIKRLGSHGAAELHKKMTEQIICSMGPILEKEKIQLQIHYCGGSLQEMETWLGRKHSFHIQQGNDLGRRMAHAFVQTKKKDSKGYFSLAPTVLALLPILLQTDWNN